MYYTYLACGGKNKAEALRASISIELAHSAMLIFDDMQDGSKTRHGRPTFHCLQDGRLGESLAELAGLLALECSHEVLMKSKFKNKYKAFEILIKTINNTIAGQKEDLLIKETPGTDHERILKMIEYKTAKYSFECPMIMGATLAGADKKTLNLLSKIAIPRGIAFQLEDDLEDDEYQYLGKRREVEKMMITALEISDKFLNKFKGKEVLKKIL